MKDTLVDRNVAPAHHRSVMYSCFATIQPVASIVLRLCGGRHSQLALGSTLFVTDRDFGTRHTQSDTGFARLVGIGCPDLRSSLCEIKEITSRSFQTSTTAESHERRAAIKASNNSVNSVTVVHAKDVVSTSATVLCVD